MAAGSRALYGREKASMTTSDADSLVHTDDTRLGTGRELGQEAAAGGVGLVLVAVEDGEQALPDLAGLLAGVDRLPDARLLVVADDRGRLLVVGIEALAEGVGVVV